jgi:hypothetical protein
MQGGVKRAIFEVEDALGSALDVLGDAVPMAGAAFQDLEDQNRQCAFEVHPFTFLCLFWTSLCIGLLWMASLPIRARIFGAFPGFWAKSQSKWVLGQRGATKKGWEKVVEAKETIDAAAVVLA